MIQTFLIAAIRLYQRLLGPVVRQLQLSAFGSVPDCKFRPTCSQYTIEQIQQHGTITGLKRGLHQLLQCW